MKIFGNLYDKAEFAGAFGDLGTLVPFIVGYITLNKMDPLGILVSLGLFKIFAGLYFRTPIPIQPMKAIGGAVLTLLLLNSRRFPAILALIILFAGLFLSSSISLILQVFPRSVLGVIMLFAGVELSMVIRDVGLKKENLFVLVVTTGIAMWNMGVAYLAGLILYHAIERKWIKI